MPNYLQKSRNYPRDIDVVSINDINHNISKGWKLESVKYDERNDELIFTYKGEIIE